MANYTKSFIMKNLLNLNGAHFLNKNEQKAIVGGGRGPICGGNCQQCESVSQVQQCCLFFPQTCP